MLADRAVVWSRSDRPARMLVEWSRRENFARAVQVRGPHALEVSGYTARVDLTGLPMDADVFVRVTFQDLDSEKATSEPITGRFRTAPRPRGCGFTCVPHACMLHACTPPEIGRAHV